MKKNEKPQLDAGWWRKSKAKTLPTTGLGKALDVYEARLDKFQWTQALTALKDVEKCAAIGVKKGSSVMHKDTIEVLKKFPALIKKEKSRIDGKIKEEAQRAASATASKPPKQKVGKAVVIWSKDFGKEFMKRYGKQHAWIKQMSGPEFALKLNDDVLDVLEKEGADVLAFRMIEQANKLFPQVMDELHIALTNAEKRTSDEGLLTAFVPKAVARYQKQYGKKFEAIPGAVWKKFVAKKKQYKDYKVDTAFSIATTGLKLVGSGLAVAAAVPTGGATLALGVYGAVQSVGSAAQVTRDFAQQAETVIKRLAKNLNKLSKEWQDMKAQATARSTGGTVANTILSYPAIPTVSTCADDWKLADNKVAGLDVKNVDFGKKVRKALTELDKLDRALAKSEDKKAISKTFREIKTLRKHLDKMLNLCSTIGARQSKAEDMLDDLGKVLKALKKGTPVYLKVFEKAFPIVHNLAMAGANAGLGFADAKTALDTANTAIGLSNDILGEINAQVA